MREQERGEVERQETPSEEKSNRQELTVEKKGDEAAKDRLNTSLSSPLTEQKKSWPKTAQIFFWKYFSLLMLVGFSNFPSFFFFNLFHVVCMICIVQVQISRNLSFNRLCN